MITLEIITPEKIIVAKKAKIVNLPLSEGDAGILPKHIPLVSGLRPGIIEIENEAGVREKYEVLGGVIQVSKKTTETTITVLAD